MTITRSPGETDPPSHPKRGSGGGALGAVAAAVALLALVLGILGLVLPSGAKKEPAPAPVTLNTPMTFEVELGDLYVKPSTIDVPANTPVILKVHNASTAMDHDLKLNGTEGTKMLTPGTSEEVNIGPVTNAAQAWCTVAGHKAAGMVLTFNVAGGHSDAAAAAPAASTDSASNNAVWDPTAAPAADWKAHDPLLPPSEAATTHKVALSMTEKVIEVAPGVTQEVWTFGDTVPGPVLRGKVGDTFEVTITNNGKITHSIDFHASEVAPDRLMTAIKPGESLAYTFTANRSGIFMYHCGTAPVLHHIGNGMYGALIVDPPNLADVDAEYVFVQSEFYFGPHGQPGDLTKMKGDNWDVIVFNGYANQYVHAPIKAEPGKRYRAWVIDDGPSENSSFHIVGTIFDTVFKEGNYLLKPDAETKGGAQALDLQPAQGGFVEWTFAEDGIYTMVTHKFSNVGKGAAGLWQVGNAELPKAGSGH